VAIMARKGDGLYLRGSTWYLDCRIDGARHVVRLGKGVNRSIAAQIAYVKRAAILKGEVGIKGNNPAYWRSTSHLVVAEANLETPPFPLFIPDMIHTYFILNPSARQVKIGRSTDPKKRFNALQTSSGSRLHFLGSIKGNIEKDLHFRLSKHRLSGEWFSWNVHIRQVVTSLLSPPRRPDVEVCTVDVHRRRTDENNTDQTVAHST